MQKRFKLIMGSGFTMLGIICGIIAVAVTINRLDVTSDSERMVARVVDVYYMEETTVVLIEYEVGGTIISTTMNWRHENVRVGQTIDVHVSRHDPYGVVEAGVSGWMTQIILFPFMVIFGGLGVMMIYADTRAKALRKWLMQNGIPVWANVQGIIYDWNIEVDGRPAIVLKAAYGLMQFTSSPLDNADLIDIRQHVKVLLHPEKPNLYAFDIHDESGLRPVNAPAPPSVRTQYEMYGHHGQYHG